LFERLTTSVLVAILALVLLAASGLVDLADAIKPNVNLFGRPPLGADASKSGPVSPFTARSAFATVNLSALRGQDGPDAVVLNLFADTNLVAIRDSIEEGRDGFSWRGHIEGEKLSSIVLTVRDDGRVAGTVDTMKQTFQVLPVSNSVMALTEVARSSLPDEMDAPMPERPAGLPPLEKVQDKMQRLSRRHDIYLGGVQVLDVLIAYTPAARINRGGTENMLAQVQLAVDQLNAALARSNVDNMRVRLVHSVEVNYAENRMDIDLGRLTTQNDGFLDELHTLRNQYGADFVSLFTTDYTYCGIAYLMPSPETWFAAYAFSVVSVYCATAGHTFAHELGE
jgi:hypothetical protein